MEIIYLILKNGCKTTNFKVSPNLLVVFFKKLRLKNEELIFSFSSFKH
jgi:hypothetical protein